MLTISNFYVMLLQFFFHVSKDGMEEIRKYVKVEARKVDYDERDLSVVNVEVSNIRDDSLEPGM